jgi:hypothetical protein
MLGSVIFVSSASRNTLERMSKEYSISFEGNEELFRHRLIAPSARYNAKILVILPLKVSA